jgi:hypothetical protein
MVSFTSSDSNRLHHPAFPIFIPDETRNAMEPKGLHLSTPLSLAVSCCFCPSSPDGGRHRAGDIRRYVVRFAEHSNAEAPLERARYPTRIAGTLSFLPAPVAEARSSS